MKNVLRKAIVRAALYEYSKGCDKEYTPEEISCFIYAEGADLFYTTHDAEEQLDYVMELRPAPPVKDEPGVVETADARRQAKRSPDGNDAYEIFDEACEKLRESYKAYGIDISHSSLHRVAYAALECVKCFEPLPQS